VVVMLACPSRSFTIWRSAPPAKPRGMRVPEPVRGDVEPEISGGESFLPHGATEPVTTDVPVRIDRARCARLVFPGGAP
jgi:hypothetical protein